MLDVTNLQARQFILLKHGLLGQHKFVGKSGALAYVRQCGCIQFDPVDACGKNAELVLQSRVKGFNKNMLNQLLYDERCLFDFPDKNLSIIPIEDWPNFERYRRAARVGGQKFDGLPELEIEAKQYIAQHGTVCAEELPMTGKMHWHSHIHWSGNWGGESNIARSVLEQLYSTGELVVHHKKGTRKYYDLAEKYIPQTILQAPDSLSDDFEHKKWRILRRIGAVGLLWDRPSDAWLNIWDLTTEQRHEAFKLLENEQKILPVRVQGIKQTLYCRIEDLTLWKKVMTEPKFNVRCELIAPLDCMMWDRKLIDALFNFHYAWEIYTPPHLRKYGFYVLPLLYGEQFIGRVEAVNERKSQTLLVKNIWYENEVKLTRQGLTAIDKCLKQLAVFNACKTLSLPDGNIIRFE